MLQSVISALSMALDTPLQQAHFRVVGGGSINAAYQLSVNGNLYFVKCNERNAFPEMFAKEKSGLELLHATATFSIPEVYDLIEKGDVSILLLEWMEQGSSSPSAEVRFAESLFQLHHNTADSFGLDFDNYIGSLPQSNQHRTDWPTFFIEQRIQPLTKRARDDQYVDASFTKKLEATYLHFQDFFPDEEPALLHGDLWSGNYFFNANAEAVLFDPAVYYGHRYMDLGMMKLFGGFSQRIFDAYAERAALPRGYERSFEVANLYPLLVHVNLFGGAYVHQVKAIVNAIS